MILSMKTLISIFLIFLFFNAASSSDNFSQSIAALVESENLTPDYSLTIFQRCAASYLTTSSTASTRSDTKVFAENLKDVASFFAYLAFQFAQDNPELKKISIEENNLVIDKLYDNYLIGLELSKSKSGQYSDGMLQDDLRVCKGIYDASISKE